MSNRPTLYHFTCSHGRRGIGIRGAVVPNHHPLLGARLSWWTTEAAPTRDTTGLTSDRLPCDRLAYRYRLLSGDVVPWLDSAARAATPPDVLAWLEPEWTRPETWWVSAAPSTAALDRAWAGTVPL